MLDDKMIANYLKITNAKSAGSDQTKCKLKFAENDKQT